MYIWTNFFDYSRISGMNKRWANFGRKSSRIWEGNSIKHRFLSVLEASITWHVINELYSNLKINGGLVEYKKNIAYYRRKQIVIVLRK